MKKNLVLTLLAGAIAGSILGAAGPEPITIRLIPSGPDTNIYFLEMRGKAPAFTTPPITIDTTWEKALKKVAETVKIPVEKLKVRISESVTPNVAMKRKKTDTPIATTFVWRTLTNKPSDEAWEELKSRVIINMEYQEIPDEEILRPAFTAIEELNKEILPKEAGVPDLMTLKTIIQNKLNTIAAGLRVTITKKGKTDHYVSRSKSKIWLEKLIRELDTLHTPAADQISQKIKDIIKITPPNAQPDAWTNPVTTFESVADVLENISDALETLKSIPPTTAAGTPATAALPTAAAPAAALPTKR